MAVASAKSFMWSLLLITAVVGTNMMALYSISATRNFERSLYELGTQIEKPSNSAIKTEDLAQALSEIRKIFETLMDELKESHAEVKGPPDTESNHVHVLLEDDEQFKPPETESNHLYMAHESHSGRKGRSYRIEKADHKGSGKHMVHNADDHNDGVHDDVVDDAAADISRRHDFPDELKKYIMVRKLPLGMNHVTGLDEMVNPIGNACFRNLDLLKQYMNYSVNHVCPDDWNIAQALMLKGCEPLPRRRCFSPSAAMLDPYPLMDSLWKLPPDDSIRWSHYTCKSIQCLNMRRTFGEYEDCIDCFDLQGIEKTRWIHHGKIDFSIDEILELKNGSIRIGLDIGGGTGSFAARMKEKGVTVVTTSLNLNGPFNEYVALRGLLPMHITVSPRLPFFDNTLDLVHSMHVLNDWLPIQALEFLLYDIDRVIRPGGLFWLDRFFCKIDQLNRTYVPMFDMLGYKVLRWQIAPKNDKRQKEVYLSALLEKPLR